MNAGFCEVPASGNYLQASEIGPSPWGGIYKEQHNYQNEGHGLNLL